MTASLPRGVFRRAALAFALVLAAAPAHAQQRGVRLTIDNDAFDFWVPGAVRPDHDYSDGVDLTADLARVPAWARRLAPHARTCAGAPDASEPCVATTASFGQKIFTPEHWGDEPVPGERPYAGWLYAAAAAHVQTSARQRTVGAEVGITGPPSLGEKVQLAVHRIAGLYTPHGWGHQLAFEPAFAVRYDERRLLADVHAGGARVLALAPAWGADAGTLHTGAHAGVTATAGYAVPHPWSSAADRRARPVSLYATGGVRMDAVARDLFLNGNTFAGGVRVTPRPLVWQREMGAGARIGGFTVEYRITTRAREYAAQERPHTWSTFSLALTPR